jgi:NADP-dependent 3-hydroxy acid dehydrogenase YdfG
MKIFLTGASSGIGRATAEALAQTGTKSGARRVT